MKILHYLLGLPPHRGGGLVRYAIDLANIQSQMGDEVRILTTGSIYRRNSSHVMIRKSKNIGQIPVYRIYNSLPVPMANGIRDIEWFTNNAGYEKYRQFLLQWQPEVIHIHSLMGIHLSFFQAAKDCRIRLIYTSHDYFGLCPKTDFIKDGCPCTNADWDICGGCCKNAFGTLHLLLDQSTAYRFFMRTKLADKVIIWLISKKAKSRENHELHYELRELPEQEYDSTMNYRVLQNYYKQIWKTINYFHFNSYIAKETFEYFLGSLPSTVIPLRNMTTVDKRRLRKYGRVLRVGFLGSGYYYKGYGVLEAAAEKLWAERKDIHLNVYFQTPLIQKDYVTQNASYQSEELDTILDNNDVIAVPSLCRETFGLVVLEALSRGVPVLVSENVGAKLILEENAGIGEIIEGDLEEGFYKCLKKLDEDKEILKRWNQNICNMDMDFSLKTHVRCLKEKVYKRDTDGKT